MLIEVSCPGCGKRYELDAKLAGKRARCRKCMREFRLPASVAGGDASDMPGQPNPHPSADAQSGKLLDAGRPRLQHSPASEPGFTPAPPPRSFWADLPTVADTELSGPPPDSPEDFALIDLYPDIEPRDPSAKRAPIAAGTARANSTGIFLVVGGFVAVTVALALLVLGRMYLTRTRGTDGRSAAVAANRNRTLQDRSEFSEIAVAEAAAALDAKSEPDFVVLAAASACDAPTQPIRDSVVTAHSQILSEVVAAFDSQTKFYAAVGPGESPRALLPKIKELERHLSELEFRETKLDRPTTAEAQTLANKYSPRLREAALALRAQVARISAFPVSSAHFEDVLKTIDEVIVQIDRQTAALAPALVANQAVALRISEVRSPEASRTIIAAIHQIDDSSAAKILAHQFDQGRRVLYVQVGPVMSANSLARKIGFGKIARTKGRAIAVVARPLGRDGLATARADARSSQTGAQVGPGTSQRALRGESESFGANRVPHADGGVSLNRIDAAIAVLDDLDHHSRNELREAVAFIGRQKPRGRRKDVARVLGDALRATQDDRGFRAEIARTLVHWAGPEEVPDLINFLKREDLFAAPEVLDYLVALKDPRCAEIFRAYLGKQRRRALSGLIGLLEGKDFEDRAKVMEAVAQVKDPRVAESLARWLPEDPDLTAKCIIALGPDAEYAVHKYVMHADKNVRRTACEILRAIGTQRSESVLQAAGGDQAPEVAKAASLALEAAHKRQAP
jgi:hypothetical protein